jgi:hypothetical protein
MRINAIAIGASLIVGSLVFTAAAQNAAPISLQEQLNAQYKLAKVGRATGEWSVVEPGTVLQIQKGGIAGVPPKSVALCPSKFEGGNLKGPSGMCTAMLGSQNIRYLTVGEKVYPVKMDVNLGKDKITFAIFECDSCNGVSDPSSYRSEVIFQFAKGYLATASAGPVEDTIGQVFSVSTGDAQSQGEAKGGEPQQEAEQPQPEPQTIHLGQTTDQVVSALGKPDKIVDLGAKQIYVYKDLKVTFANGKVSDVQ